MLPSFRTGAPFLHQLLISQKEEYRDHHPFNLPILEEGLRLTFQSRVTFFVGENGSGKSTILEGLAECCGYAPEGGNRDHNRFMFEQRSPFAQAMTLSWNPRVTEGFFLRAESFFNFATYLEEVGSDFWSYGGKSLHKQSHGESFLALFENRFEQGLYILDEPEAALSPQRQLSLLKIIHNLESPGHAQFIIATHSPILLTYPGASLLSFDGGDVSEIQYQDTDHYRLTKDFLNSPERFHRYLFEDGE